MTPRRRFTSDFKANVALEALRGDKTIQGEKLEAARETAQESVVKEKNEGK